MKRNNFLVNMSMNIISNVTQRLGSVMQPHRRFNIEIIKKPTILGSVNHLYLTSKLSCAPNYNKCHCYRRIQNVTLKELDNDLKYQLSVLEKYGEWCPYHPPPTPEMAYHLENDMKEALSLLVKEKIA